MNAKYLALALGCLLTLSVSASDQDRALLQQAQKLSAREPQQALTLLQQLSDGASPATLQQAELLNCEIYLDLGKAELALQAPQGAEPAQNPVTHISLLLCRAGALQRLGEIEQAFEQLDQAESASRRINDPNLLARTLLQRAELHILQDQQESAFSLIENAYDIADQNNLVPLKQNALNLLALVYYNSGRLDMAEQYYRELVEIAQQSGNREHLAIGLFNLGHALASQEKFTAADAVLERSLELSQSLNDQLGRAFTLKALAESSQAQGNLQLADQRFTEALAIFKRAGELKQYATTLRHLGDLSQLKQDYQQAVSYYQEAVPILKEHHFTVALMRTYRGLAEVYGLLENYAQAYRYHYAYTLLLQESLEQRNLETMQRMQAEFETQRLLDEKQQLETRIEQDRKFRILLIAAVGLALLAAALAALLWYRSHQYGGRMRQLATQDELTQLQNRRALLEIGEAEWRRAKRFGNPLVCLLFDIDHFKSVNDTYGHPIGDLVIRQVADNVRKQLRRSDTLGRYGGEEFLLIAADTNATQAQVLAKRILQAVGSTVYPQMPGRQITVSIGIAELSNESNLRQLIQHADEALYRAKDAGRNRAELHSAESNEPLESLQQVVPRSH